MSGKAEGKKRNRASQSEQHGYQQPNLGPIGGHETGMSPDSHPAGFSEKQRVMEKIREMERRRLHKRA